MKGKTCLSTVNITQVYQLHLYSGTFNPQMITLNMFCGRMSLDQRYDKIKGRSDAHLNSIIKSWYQQYPGSSPIFLLLTGVSSNPSVVKAKPEDPRLSVKLNDERTRVDLEISSAKEKDCYLLLCTDAHSERKPTNSLQKPNPTHSIRTKHDLQEMEERRISWCHHGLATSVVYSSPIDLTVADMGPWLSNLLILAACCYECRGEDSVIKPPEDVIATEGEQVILDCQFDAVNMNDIYLFWYKLEVNDFPKFMLGRFPFGSKNATEFKDRFDAHLDADSKSVPLTIQRVQLSDSAVYYCALRPTDIQPHYKNYLITLREPTGSSSLMLPKAELKKWFQHLLTHTSVFALSLPTHLTVNMESWLKKFLVLSAFCWECRGDRVLQTKGVETAAEGGQITLVCHYETDDPSPYLFWYKQGANDFPKYMLLRFKFGTGDNATEFKERFHADLDANSKSVPLTIQRVQLSDSARYYSHIFYTLLQFHYSFFTGQIAGDHINPVNNEVISTEGELVTLSCSYDTSGEYPLLYWYRHYSNQAPQFLLYKDSTTEFKERFDAHLNVTAKSFPLKIQRLQLSDSAVYDCALRPTVTTGYTAPLQKRVFVCV
ncbi:unnamed protein product [Oncorhynchus mykiss]|uniref:Ig-like domain-containing protein n=1 Tax=Oncorhynchus mykiss TaxID=8022 RepID=A0A060XAQ7_ONCMY|nr:unnamed protein product [Oncorhynchus mykiss]